MKTTSRKPSPKATKCWANVYPDGRNTCYFKKATAGFLLNQNFDGRTVPAWLLTQDQIPAVIEAMARAIHRSVESFYTPALRDTWGEIHKERKSLFRAHARAALRAASVG